MCLYVTLSSVAEDGLLSELPLWRLGFDEQPFLSLQLVPLIQPSRIWGGWQAITSQFAFIYVNTGLGLYGLWLLRKASLVRNLVRAGYDGSDLYLLLPSDRYQMEWRKFFLDSVQKEVCHLVQGTSGSPQVLLHYSLPHLLGIGSEVCGTCVHVFLRASADQMGCFICKTFEISQESTLSFGSHQVIEKYRS